MHGATILEGQAELIGNKSGWAGSVNGQGEWTRQGDWRRQGKWTGQGE